MGQPQWENWKETDVRTVNPDSLVDIRTVKINPDLPRAERITSFLEQIGNPYCCKCGDLIVKISFAEDGPSLEDRLQSMESI